VIPNLDEGMRIVVLSKDGAHFRVFLYEAGSLREVTEDHELRHLTIKIGDQLVEGFHVGSSR